MGCIAQFGTVWLHLPDGFQHTLSFKWDWWYQFILPALKTFTTVFEKPQCQPASAIFIAWEPFQNTALGVSICVLCSWGSLCICKFKQKSLLDCVNTFEFNTYAEKTITFLCFSALCCECRAFQKVVILVFRTSGTFLQSIFSNT